SSWFGPTLGVFSVARFTSAGSLDPTFGNKGIALANYPNLKTVTRAIAIGSDRKIVLAGSVHDYDPATGDSTRTTRFAAVRVPGAGQVDTSFHHNGMQTVDITDKGADEANAVALADNGGIVLGGFVANGAKSRDFALVRLRADGTRDHSFSKNGILAIDFGTGRDDRPEAMLLSSAGQCAVARTCLHRHAT